MRRHSRPTNVRFPAVNLPRAAGGASRVGMQHNGKIGTDAMCLHVENVDWNGHFGQHITGQQLDRDRAERTAKLRGRDGFVG